MTFPMVSIETTHRKVLVLGAHSDGLQGKRATNTPEIVFIFKNVKLGETLIFRLSKIKFYVIFHDVNTSRVNYTETCVGGHSSLR